LIRRQNRGVSTEALGEDIGKMTPRIPKSRATDHAIQQAAEHTNEVEAILEDWGKRGLVPASLGSDFYEMRYHLQTALRWLQEQGAKVEPEDM